MMISPTQNNVYICFGCTSLSLCIKIVVATKSLGKMDELDHLMERMKKNRLDEQQAKSKTRRIKQMKSKHRKNANYLNKKNGPQTNICKVEETNDLQTNPSSRGKNIESKPIKRGEEVDPHFIKSEKHHPESQVVDTPLINPDMFVPKSEEVDVPFIKSEKPEPEKEEVDPPFIKDEKLKPQSQDLDPTFMKVEKPEPEFKTDVWNTNDNSRSRESHNKYNSNRMRQSCSSKTCSLCPKCRDSYRCVVVTKEQCNQIQSNRDCWELLSVEVTDKESARELVQNVFRQLKIIHKPPKETLPDGSYAPGEVYESSSIDYNWKHMLSVVICGKAVAVTIKHLLPEAGEIDSISTIEHNPYEFIHRTSDAFPRQEDIRYLSIMLTLRAGSLIEIGEYRKALKDSQDAVFCSPDCIESHWHLADSSKLLGLAAQAEDSFEEVRALLCKRFNYQKLGTFFRRHFDYVFEATVLDSLGQRIAYVRGGKKKTVYFWNEDERDAFQKIVYCQDGVVIPATKFPQLFVATLENKGISHKAHMNEFFTKFAREQLFTEEEWEKMTQEKCTNAIEEGKLLYAYATNGKFRVLQCMMPESTVWKEHFSRRCSDLYTPSQYELKKNDLDEKRADKETMNNVVRQNRKQMMQEVDKLNEEKDLNMLALLRRYTEQNRR